MFLTARPWNHNGRIRRQQRRNKYRYRDFPLDGYSADFDGHIGMVYWRRRARYTGESKSRSYLECVRLLLYSL